MGVGPFSWSFTRSQAIATCPRLFLFQYYSWDEGFADSVRLLKPLLSLPMLAGQVVDVTISRALERAKTTGEMPNELHSQGVELFQDLVRTSSGVVASMHRGIQAPNASRPLHSDYYERPEWSGARNQAEDKVRNCLYNFEISPLLKHVLKVPPEQWGPFRTSFADLPPRFVFDDIGVWANYDFYLDDGGQTFIVDWKTGKANPEKEQFQLGVYALHANIKRDFPVGRISVQIANLNDPPDWSPTAINEEVLDAVKRRIKAEAAAELAIVTRTDKVWRDNPLYFAEADSFLPDPAPGKCAGCNYLQLCPEGTAAAELRPTAPPATDEADPFAGE